MTTCPQGAWSIVEIREDAQPASDAQASSANKPVEAPASAPVNWIEQMVADALARDRERHELAIRFVALAAQDFSAVLQLRSEMDVVLGCLESARTAAVKIPDGTSGALQLALCLSTASSDLFALRVIVTQSLEAADRQVGELTH